MRSFKEIVLEGLTYKSNPTLISKFKNINDYKIREEGDYVSYSLKSEQVFIFNIKTSKLLITKQGWQLMNLERGF